MCVYIYIYIYICTCVYVCMCILHACMHAWDGWRDGWMDGWIDACGNRRSEGGRGRRRAAYRSCCHRTAAPGSQCGGFLHTYLVFIVRVSLCMSACACMHVRMRGCMYACMHACVCVCVYMCAYRYVHVCVCVLHGHTLSVCARERACSCGPPWEGIGIAPLLLLAAPCCTLDAPTTSATPATQR